MRFFDDAYKNARDERPFSNGTEGHGWMASWCERCVHDVDNDGVDGEGCPLVMVAVMQRTPAEWRDGPRSADGGYSIHSQYECTEYQPQGQEAAPVEPPLPGQISLLD